MRNSKQEKRIIRFYDKEKNFLFDIRFTKPEEWGACMVFYTGPMELNIIQRSKAKKMGLMLNERGIFKRSTDEKGKLAAGQKLGGETEESVYKVLGMDYMTPQERDRFKKK